MNWTLEVVWVPVSDVDHAKAFYAEQLGFNVDRDTQVSEANRIVQLVPPGSGCSIVIGEGTIAPEMPPGSLKGVAAGRSRRSTRHTLSSASEGWRSVRSRSWARTPASARPTRQCRIRLLQRSGRQRVGRAADICRRRLSPAAPRAISGCRFCCCPRYERVRGRRAHACQGRPAEVPLGRSRCIRCIGTTCARDRQEARAASLSHRGLLADEPLAMVDQQPQIEFGPSSCAAGKASKPSCSAARATAIASIASDFPRRRARRRARAVSFVVMRRTRSPRRDQKPLKGARHVPAVLDRPHRSLPSPRAQRNSTPKPLAPTGTVCPPSTSPVAAETAAIVCERLWVSAPSTIIRPRPSCPPLQCGPLADTACWRRCHASIKSRRTSPTGDERHSKRRSGPSPADSLKESQLAARSGPSSAASDVTDEPNRNSKPQRSSAVRPREAQRCTRRVPRRMSASSGGSVDVA